MNNSTPKQGPNTMSYSGPSAVNPMTTESPYNPPSESTHSGRSYSPDHPGERVSDSTVLAMQYVNHSNMTTPGYTYAQHGKSEEQGGTDVDMDCAYASMTEVRHEVRQRKQTMNGENVKENMETGYGYAAVPNKAQRSNNGTWCMIQLIWNALLLFIVLAAFGLSVYNFISKEVNTVTTSPTTEPMQLTGEDKDDVSAQIAQLNTTVTELKAMLLAMHQRNYSKVNETILAAIESVQSVSPTNELDVTFGCQEYSAECVINHNEAGSTPSFATCETSDLDLSVDGMRNVNVYCNIDNTVEEANPLVATLNINNDAISCICGIVAISPATHSPACKLHVYRCPKTISLNTTM